MKDLSVVKYRRAVGEKHISVKCDRELSRQAEWLLDLIKERQSQREFLSHGTTIEIGWAILTVVEAHGTFTLLAPDFARNPFNDTTDDLTVFLRVQAMQNDVVARLGIEAQGVSFQDKVVTAKGAVGEEHVYLERAPETSQGDSGWYVGPVESGGERPQLKAIYVFELLKYRPCLMQVLTLPPGYLVVFDGDKIETILNTANVDVWHSNKGDSGPDAKRRPEKGGGLA